MRYTPPNQTLRWAKARRRQARLERKRGLKTSEMLKQRAEDRQRFEENRTDRPL